MTARRDAPVLVAALLALTFATGMIDAVSFIALGQVFTANMTGNVALLGFAPFVSELSVPRSLTALAAGLGTMFLWWWLVDSYWLLAIFAVIFGSLYGGYVALAPTLCMDLFGARHVAGIIGSLYTAAGFGTLIGPTAAGAAFDAYGAYDAPILACALLCFAGAALSLPLLRARPATAAA